MKTIFTQSIEPTIEVDTKAGRENYVLKLNLISPSDLCTELSNVMAARHNLIMTPSKVTEAIEKQRTMSDVIDKAALICAHVFGPQAIYEYSNGDLPVFIELVHNIDEEVAQQDMDPDQHGSIVLRKLGENLKNKKLADTEASLAAPAAYITEDTKVSFEQFMQNHKAEQAASKRLESINVNLTPSKYLSAEGKYLRAKLANNELGSSSVKLEVLHDKFNANDSLALEVYCNQISIGYIQKIGSDVDIDKYCFIDNRTKRELTIEWGNSGFSLFGMVTEAQIKGEETMQSDSNDESWIGRLRNWAAENDVTELPPENDQLKNLTSLNLSSINKLTELPPEIGQLKNLTNLDLSYSKLTELPPEIGQLQNLITLNLCNTFRLTKLPPEIGQLQNLSILDIDMSGLKLAELPPEIGQLKNLRIVY